MAFIVFLIQFGLLMSFWAWPFYIAPEFFIGGMAALSVVLGVLAYSAGYEAGRNAGFRKSRKPYGRPSA